MFGFVLHLIKIMPISDGMQYGFLPLVAGILGGAQVIGGIAQALSSSNRKREPEYKIPKEVFRATEMAEEAAKTGMAEESRMQALQSAQQSALFGMRAAQDRRGGLASIGNIQAGLDRSKLAIAAQDASIRLQNQRFAQQALMTQAQFRDKAFANQWQSWANAEQQRIETRNAGFQNMMGGLTSIGTMASMGAFGGGGTKPFGGTELISATSGLSGQRNNISGMNAIMGTGIMPPGMPGSQLSSPSSITQPSYGLTSDQILSRSIFQSLIR
jgi:hypothetical protein